MHPFNSAMNAVRFDRTKAVEPSPFPMGARPLEMLERGFGPQYEEARLKVERLLSRYPEEHLEALLSRLHAREASQSNDAFFELFVLNLFLDSGFKLVGIEQPLPHTQYVVDFTFESPAGLPLMVEVVSYNPRRELVGPKKLMAEVYNALDSVECGRLQVEVTEVRGCPTQSVPKKVLKSRVATWLKSLPDNPAGLSRQFEVSEQCSVTLVAMLRTADSRPGLLVALPKDESPSNIVEGVRRKLYQKAFKYGPLRAPLVVALNVSSEMGATRELFDKAVFGPPDYTMLPKEHLGYPGEYVPSAGALLEEGGPLSRVPAVLGFLGVSPLDCEYTAGVVYYSKYAPPFNLGALKLPTFRAPAVPQFDARCLN